MKRNKANINPINEVKNQLDQVRETHFTTGEVRKVSSKTFKLIQDKQIDYVLDLCEVLLEERDWAMGVVAYDWAYRMKKQYTRETFYIFEKWLIKYVNGWGDCDDFCTHAFGELLSQYNDLFDHVINWTNHEAFWVRRAASVILIYPIKKGRFDGLDPFIISDHLMNDHHDLVLKGYGWMLKILSQFKPDAVKQYLITNKEKMPRVSFRYAIEKYNDEQRINLLNC